MSGYTQAVPVKLLSGAFRPLGKIDLSCAMAEKLTKIAAIISCNLDVKIGFFIRNGMFLRLLIQIPEYTVFIW